MSMSACARFTGVALSIILLGASVNHAKSRAPVACLVPSPAEVDFGQVRVGDRAVRELRVKNTCHHAVKVQSLTVSPAAFGTAAQAPIQIPALHSYALPIHFSPADTGSVGGEARLVSHRQALRIALRGRGAAASVQGRRLEVSPAFIDETLPAGSMVGRTLMVKNTSEDSLGVYVQTLVEAPGTGGDTPGPRLSVLYLSTINDDDIESNFVHYLQNQAKVSSVTIRSGIERTPSLDALLGYGLIVVASGAAWADPDSVGDILADYVDRGGKLILMHAALSELPGFGLGGRIVGPDYSPVPKAGHAGFATSRNFVDHPLVANVEWFSSNSILAVTETQGAGLPLGYYSSEFLAAAYNPTRPVLYINVIPWEGEFVGAAAIGQMISNAIDHFQGTFNWLKTPALRERRLFRLGPGESRQVLVPVGHYFSLPMGVHHGSIQFGEDREGSQVRIPAVLRIE